MIVNELYTGQGLGNQLWNYVVARILADTLDCPFGIMGQSTFKGQDFMSLDFGQAVTGGSSPEGGPATTLPHGIQHYYRERRENLRGTTTDISRTDPGILAIQPSTKFDGNCQSTKYLAGYHDQIRQWIAITPSPDAQLPPNACLIHMRCGDFSGLKDVFLPPEYYRQAVENVRKAHPGVTFFCVTDQPNVAKKILQEVEIVGASLVKTDDARRAAHHRGGPIAIDFTLMMQAEYLIIPNSSFSWWAAYLSMNKKMIIAPKYWARYNAGDGFWSTSDCITEGFLYQDKAGQLMSAVDCWQEKDAFEATRQDMFVTADPTTVLPTLTTAPTTILGKVRLRFDQVLHQLKHRGQNR